MSDRESDPGTIPTSKDVIAWLNARFEARGLACRVDFLVVLPYMNPMWMANWTVPELPDAPDRDVLDEELREARWRYPQVLEDL